MIYSTINRKLANNIALPQFYLCSFISTKIFLQKAVFAFTRRSSIRMETVVQSLCKSNGKKQYTVRHVPVLHQPGNSNRKSYSICKSVSCKKKLYHSYVPLSSIFVVTNFIWIQDHYFYSVVADIYLVHYCELAAC